MMLRMEIPTQVEDTIAELATDLSAVEIWLIGSRVAGVLRPDSDWDLLVISPIEIVPRAARRKGIDVFWLGPSGVLKLEGSDHRFAPIDWKSTGLTAEYTGKSSKHHEDGVARDAEKPFYEYPRLAAIPLWKRGNRPLAKD